MLELRVGTCGMDYALDSCRALSQPLSGLMAPSTHHLGDPSTIADPLVHAGKPLANSNTHTWSSRAASQQQTTMRMLLPMP